MIIDDKLICLANQIIQRLKTSELLFSYKQDKCRIRLINLSHTAMLRIVVDKEVLTEYPEDNCYTLPVKGTGYFDENPIDLDFKGYHKFDYDNERDMRVFELLSGSIMSIMIDSKDYVNYSFDNLKKEMYDVDHAFEGSHSPSISFRYGENHSSISTNLLRECIFGDVKKIDFKVLSTEHPLFFKYNTVLEELPCTVYGVVAARIDTEGDSFIRLC